MEIKSWDRACRVQTSLDVEVRKEDQAGLCHRTSKLSYGTTGSHLKRGVKRKWEVGTSLNEPMVPLTQALCSVCFCSSVVGRSLRKFLIMSFSAEGRLRMGEGAIRRIGAGVGVMLSPRGSKRAGFKREGSLKSRVGIEPAGSKRL